MKRLMRSPEKELAQENAMLCYFVKLIILVKKMRATFKLNKLK